ncbi:MAG: hypothetical protein HW420_1092, partial [Candidatus Nitrosotenuis sp.]|nr:hypothetical protein [Candidatus Nitrosotenuis sp.]
RFPDESVVVQVIVVSPSLNVSGESFVTEDIITASVASASPSTTVSPSYDVASSVISDGAAIVGAVVSTIVTFWVAVDRFPDINYCNLLGGSG